MQNISLHKTSLVLFLAVFGTSTASAEIFKWVDSNGVMHYSDERPKDKSIKTTTVRILKAPRKRETEEETEDNAPKAKSDSDAPEQTDQNTSTPQKLAAALQTQASLNQDTQEKIDIAQQQQCGKARTNLAILSKDIPVYMNDDEAYRLNWAGDTYKGGRTYLSKDERAQAQEEAKATIKSYCSDPDDKTAQDQARKKWVHSEYCLLNRAILDDLQRLEIRASRRQLQRQLALTDKYCNEDASILPDEPEPEIFQR